MVRVLYIVCKSLFLYLTVFGLGAVGFAPFLPAEELTGTATPAGDTALYAQLETEDAGWDTYQPGRVYGGYRYGPSMILNDDGSIDLWSAANGTSGFWDVITYSRLYNGGKNRTVERVALSPTAGAEDAFSTCDPGVIRFGGYYYIGYTSTMDARGTDNNVYVARSKDPAGPYEKWTGSGWGTAPAPLVEYTGNVDCFGAGEPSFVRMGDTLYVYYSWVDENGAATRVATADATDENWPATLVEHGVCIPAKNGGDSTDVKYADAFGRFIAVYTEQRFSDESYVAVWESFDGLTFRPSGFVKTNTMKKLHNCGVSGRSDGHICADDPVYLSYAYGSDWGRWPTRMHKVTLTLADAPKTNSAAEENLEGSSSVHRERAIPEIIMIAAKESTLTVEKSADILIFAYDSDNFNSPVLAGVRYSGYDTSLIRIIGNRVYARGTGTTRVTASWNGYACTFVVNARHGTGTGGRVC